MKKIDILKEIECIVLLSDRKMEMLAGGLEVDAFNHENVLRHIEGLPASTTWADYRSFAKNPGNRDRQLDLLGFTKEPVVFYPLISEEAAPVRWLLVKLKASETPEDLNYDINQKYLIEQWIKLWSESCLISENHSDVATNNIIYVSKYQDIIIDELNDKISNKDYIIYRLVLEYFLHVIREIKPPHQRVTLSDSLITWLIEHQINLNEYHREITDAYEVAVALSPTESDIQIKSYYFLPQARLDNSPPPGNSKVSAQDPGSSDPVTVTPPSNLPSTPRTVAIGSPPGTGDSKLHKTLLLLDRYEAAASVLIDNKIPVLGKNLAAACDPPISAPALTDSMNKHRTRILMAIERFPDRWPLIKTHYQVIRQWIM